MEYRSGSQIREDFLRFFEEKAHRRVHSSSLVPANDPTLLFTNAGMNQFKDVFLGAEQRAYTRAVSSQKCVRAGGKHNDLENVGFTRRHHTFFEMLGNFSFGDYFKRDAIAFAWELLTSPRWFGIDPARLYVTIFEGSAPGSGSPVPRDTEAEDLWIAAGVPRERIYEMSMKDNFWQMGDTGPCGPCSEIFFDLGLEAGETGEDKPFPHDDQRYMEIWNLVFMQFDRSADGTLTPLPKPSIDTGMGLERIACVLQGVLSNYQTDLFLPLIARAAELTGTPLEPSPSNSHPGTDAGAPSFESHPKGGVSFAEANDPSPLLSLDQTAVSDSKSAASLRIIADHARAATFLIADGVLPANEGRGYVLRKILRRGIRHGRLLGQEQPFMHQMVFAVRVEMQTAYPELGELTERVSKVVFAEEEQFIRVMELGAKQLEAALTGVRQGKGFETIKNFATTHNLPLDRMALGRRAWTLLSVDFQDWSVIYNDLFCRGGLEPWLRDTKAFREAVEQARGSLELPGAELFSLYETYGIPLDFMVDAARDVGIGADVRGFEAAKAEEQARARASWKGGSQKSASPAFRDLPKTEFEGYTALRVDGARVLALVKDGLGVPELNPGDEGEVVLDATSFYADSGGQVGDTGLLLAPDHQTPVAEVRGCTKPVQGVFAHRVLARARIAIGDELDTAVTPESRAATTRNHTGTHLLHAALREVLGTHVKQAGSLVNPTRLRFDFSHFSSVAEPELREIESIVNAQILANTPVQTLVDVPIDTAVNDLGATALFGEKYGDKVRVVKIGSFSTELCGGIHTRATGEIGLLKLVGESSVASGVRRVEAVSGTVALEEFRRGFEVARIVGGDHPAETLRQRFESTEEELRKLRRELDAMRLKSAQAATAGASDSAVEVKGIKLLAQRVDGVDKAQLRDLVDQLRTKLGSGIVVLGSASEGKVSLIVGVTKNLTSCIQAGKLVGQLAALVGGKGGGRPDLAEAGGSDVSALDSALAQAARIVAGLLP